MTNLLSGIRFLVVEDDDSLRLALFEFLQMVGGTVVQARNGVEGLRCIDAERFDVILSDIQMPEMDGIDLLKNIRQMGRNVPIVLLSTGHAEMTEELALQLGADCLIQKPFKLKYLLETIADLVEGARQRSDNPEERPHG